VFSYYYQDILHLIVITENWETLCRLKNKDAVFLFMKILQFIILLTNETTEYIFDNNKIMKIFK